MDLNFMAFLTGLKQFAEMLQRVTPFIAGVTGVLFIIKALWMAIKCTDRGSRGDPAVSPGRVLGWMVVGAFLAMFSRTATDFQSMTDVGLRASVAYSAVGASGSPIWELGQQVVCAWLMAIGIIFIYVGGLKLSKIVSGKSDGSGDPLWAAIWHIIGGGVCINLGTLG